MCWTTPPGGPPLRKSMNVRPPRERIGSVLRGLGSDRFPAGPTWGRIGFELGGLGPDRFSTGAARGRMSFV